MCLLNMWELLRGVARAKKPSGAAFGGEQSSNGRDAGPQVPGARLFFGHFHLLFHVVLQMVMPENTFLIALQEVWNLGVQ